MEETLGVVTVAADNASVRLERHYDATAMELWSALVEPEQLKGWLGETVVEPRVGGRFEVRFAGDETARCVIRTFDPPRVLELDLDFDDEPSSVLRFELEERESGTTLVLDHRLLAAKDAPQYGAGWHVHLAVLDERLAGRAGRWERSRYEELLPAYEGRAAALTG